jgi:exopolysaccharide production protein ExoY
MNEIWLGLISGLLGIIWAEFNDWLPWLSKKIMAAAVRALPPGKRERYAEEWAGVLADTPGKIWPFLNACGFWWGASKERVRKAIGTFAFEPAWRIVDVVGALTFFIFFGPLYLLVGLGIKASMGGIAHVYQIRYGKDGRPFRFFKFRSLSDAEAAQLDEYFARNNADNMTTAEVQELLKNAPALSTFGKIIRKFSLDELPQFWNVLKGDMSLVGPRPCLKQHQEFYGDAWDDYCSVRPGITGLWQVSGRNRLTYQERVSLDAEYAKNKSHWLNIKILLKTMRAALTDEGSENHPK